MKKLNELMENKMRISSKLQEAGIEETNKPEAKETEEAINLKEENMEELYKMLVAEINKYNELWAFKPMNQKLINGEDIIHDK